MVNKLQVQLRVRERELDNREGAIIAREDGLVASEHDLGRACTEYDAKRAQAKAIR
jgi:adhesin HecA-like repeat protein